MAKKSQAPAIAEGLARAPVLADELNSVTDELNASIQEVERALADLRLGVKASVVLYDQTSPPWTGLLSFGKQQQEWRLLYESGMEGDGDDDWETTPLVNASRAIRLDAVDLLPKLVEALIRTAAEEVETVRAKTASLKNLSETIRASQVPPPGSGPDDIPF